jgi:hypothetical protein
MTSSSIRITKHRLVSAEEATSQLDALALHNGITENLYEESSASSMAEFSALKWISLCFQRRVLLEREALKKAS